MADRSAIEWTDASWNPIRARNLKTGRVGWHCEHATTGCEHCYSEGFNKRLGTGLPFKPGHRKDIEVFLDEEMLTQPLRWKKPRRIFVCSMTDAFADFVTDEMLDRMFAVMALATQHTFQVLTKRAKRMREYLCGDWAHRSYGIAKALPGFAFGKINIVSGSLPNVWLGVSAERQPEADERIPDLLATPAVVRFVSIEPMLGPITLYSVGGRTWAQDSLTIVHDALAGFRGDQANTAKLDWVIVGGESGRSARPMHPDWARALRDQCASAKVAFLFKQWGEWAPQIGAGDGWSIADNPEISRFDHREWEDGRWSEVFRPMWCDFQDGNYDEAQTVSRIGKKAAGRLLDGVEHNEFPRVPA
ncbi:DUF5131 family protein [Bradyrhizobium sp. SEMIA]|uniref:DUF5131 family protein n=1 Tax=Bradyrhizobium sp. SEMIA TaxID=2597515 RepID=UPI0018A4B1B0|nr:phage Gp37/Gp68 family protein [Bradyrhizobium sp. SEMIA]QOG20426.1 DUF5131 family protein [Bradyrhizobium sp. SEMIA]